MVYRQLGEMLIAAGYISEEQLNKALEAQRKSKTGEKLGEVVVRLGYITQRQLNDVLGKQLGCPFIDLNSAVLPKELARIVPRTIAKKYNIVPVRATEDTIYIAMADPLNFVAIDETHMATKRRVEPMLATGEGISRAIADLYGSETAEKALQDLKGSEADKATTDFQNIAAANVIGADNENAAPTIRLVNSFLEYAVNQSCSDIHLEPREAEMVVRMRIDGVLRRVFTVPRTTQNAVIARIKVMGNMDIAEHKIPLDGRSNIRVGDKDIDLRIQFVYNVRQGRLTGVEALSRWNHPEKGILSPAAFVQGMNFVGIGDQLDFCMLEKSCQLMERWKEEGLDHLGLSCNFTRTTMSDERFAERVLEIVGRHDLNRDRLTLEITEDTAASKPEMIRENMLRCKKAGLAFALDDLGAGYSSMRDLCDYPIDFVKIDRSLTNRARTEQGFTILKGIITTIHAMGLEALCEGVETEEQLDTVIRAGCDYIQGFYFSRVYPIPDGMEHYYNSRYR